MLLTALEGLVTLVALALLAGAVVMTVVSLAVLWIA